MKVYNTCLNFSSRNMRAREFEEGHSRKICVHKYSFLLDNKRWFKRIKKTQRMIKINISNIEEIK